MEQKQWYDQSSQQVADILSVNPEQGLSDEEAQIRIEKYGSNELVKAKLKSPWELLAEQFKDFMIGLLVVAALISVFIGEAKDTIAIIVIVILNAIIGFVQAYRAEKAIEELRKLSAPGSQVKRNGELKNLSSIDVVPGDIVVLEAGNIVPADLRLVELAGLSINESILTGESLPIDKTAASLPGGKNLLVGDRINMAFSGTQVTRGRGTGIVTETGMETEIGKIAGMLHGEDMKTPLQKRLNTFGKNLVFIVIAISLIVFIVGIARGEDASLMFLTAVSLAVAAVPEALPAVVTISLALGAQRMVRMNSLIRRLPAVETLGSMTYICSDKTGTLTQNKMKAEEIYVDDRIVRITGEGYQPIGEFQINSKLIAIESLPSARLFMQAAALNGDARITRQEADGQMEIIGDPTELALVVTAEKAGYRKADLEATMPRIGELPFDSERKKMTTIHRTESGIVSFTKGAFENISTGLTAYISNGEIKALDEDKRLELNAVYETMASKGLRALALAFKQWPEKPAEDVDSLENELVLLGLVGIVDPPREEALQAVKECKTAGIIPVMITGDHPATAKNIAQRLGIFREGADSYITGEELVALDLEEFENRVERIRVYARVAPEHKDKIVKALQDKGEIVAMTGDGVNDAPALKNADIGVAMGITGTDVSKEAADMVLLDDNFATIVKAVKEGRKIYDNIRRFIKYTLTSNSGEILVMFMAPFLNLPIPLLPIHILWINLVTDGLPGLALAIEPPEKDVMERPPRHPKESVFAQGLWQHVVWVGILMAGVTLFAQAWFYQDGRGVWQTVVFTVLALSQMGHAFAVRSEKQSMFQLGLFSNWPLLGAIALTFILQAAIIYNPLLNSVFRTQPLNVSQIGIALLLSTIVFFAVEGEKLVKRSLLKTSKLL